ncbi:MAG: IclR family transcriptional regulator [Halarchaeum sp.]
MSGGDDGGGRQLKSVRRAFEIVEHLRASGPATLSDVAASLDVPMSTAHIHLSTLVETGYLVKVDGEYRCSLRFLETGGDLRDEMPLFEVAKAEVDDLQEQLGEIANLGTRESGYLVKLYKAEDETSIDDNAPIGHHFYLHTTAMGKAMLAQLPGDEVDAILDRRGLPQMTEGAIADREALTADLEAARERGYAVNDEEHFGGVRAVAVPIMSDSGEAIGSISLSGPVSRMDDERIGDEIVPALRDKRNVVELRLRQY